MFGMLALGEGLYVIQALIGVVMALNGLAPARGIVHYLYGVIMIIAIPGIYLFTRGRNGKNEALLYAMMAFFLAGVAFRAMTTATNNSSRLRSSQKFSSRMSRMFRI